jgi:hypothetical protein
MSTEVDSKALRMLRAGKLFFLNLRAGKDMHNFPRPGPIFATRGGTALARAAEGAAPATA